MCATKDLAVSAEADGRQLERLQLSPRRKSDSTLSSPVSSPMPPPAIKTDAPERTASWTGPQSGSKVSFATTYPVGGAPKAMVPLPSPGKKKPPSPHAMMTPLRRVSSTDKDNRPSKSQRGISNELSATRDVQPRELTATSSGSGSSWMFRSRMSQSLLPVPAPPPPRSQTKHDQAAALMGLLAASGLTMESLLQMNEEKQRETLIAAATIRNSSRLTEQERLQLRRGQSAESDAASKRVSMKALVSFKLPPTPEVNESPDSPPVPKSGTPTDPRKAMMAMLAKRGGGEEPAPVPSPVDPRKAMMAMLAKRGGGEEPTPAASNSASNGAVALKDCPTFGKYFKMMKVGLPRPAVVQKMMSDGAVSSEEKGLDILALGGDGPSPIPGVSTPAAAADPRKAMMDMLAKKAGGSESAASSSGTVPLKDCKTFGKYFKMMKVGLPTPAVVQKMMSDGAVSSEQKGFDILALGGDGPSPILGQAPAGGGDAAKNMMDMLAKRSGGVGGAPNSDPKVALKDHPSYAKYFKMLKVGLPKDNVKFKMEQDGLDKDILDRDPESLVSSKDPKAAAAEEAEDVAVSYHPKYGKYFRMLSVRLPKDAIKAKMEADGLDPDFLDKNPEERIPRGMNSEDMLSEMPHKPAALSVTFADHPQYGKFFKMLKVGLPKEAVKSKMTNEGLNPDFLDMNATDMVPQEKSNKGKSSNRIKSQRIKSQRIKSVAHALTALGAGAKGVPKVRKKKLYWKALTVNQVGSDSMWNEDEIDITLDEAEFNKLFVET
jgi:Subunit CCDC53 of WASH complex